MGKLMLNGDVVGGGVSNARMTSFDNRENGFAADNVQAAIEEASKMGADPSITLTLAEYEALGDKVNSDNITYFITDDNEDEPTETLNNMRYNPETDVIEIYYNDTWVEWKIAKLQTYPINFISEVISSDFIKGLTGPTITIGDTFKTVTTSITPATGYADYKTILPISEGAVLNAKGTLGISVGSMPGVTQTCRFSIQFSKDKGSTWTDVKSASCNIKSAYSASVAFDFTNTDLSAYVGNDVMLRILIYSNLSGANVTTTLTQFDIVYP